MAAGCCRYSCDTAEQTMEWMAAIADFLRPFGPLLDAHVVNFFKVRLDVSLLHGSRSFSCLFRCYFLMDCGVSACFYSLLQDRLWETVDEQWMECLRRGPLEDVLGIPCGLVREHWPSSLQEFIKTLQSLVLSREPKLPLIFGDFQVIQLGSVLSQGMNRKKKHEVEILSAVVSTIANDVGAHSIIDVGSGQGYLAQVLCFQYNLSVIALDASSHHATVTSSRAERIKKHFAAKLRKSSNGNKNVPVPRTVTCQILSSCTLMAVIENMKESSLCHDQYAGSSLVLAGLHACGDLSVNMLRTFIECEQVKAVICISCCYNLLSKEPYENSSSCSFPMSNGAKLFGLALGRNACDLGCQSEERWRNLAKDVALQNLELHALRAAFQLILDKYYPVKLASIPSIGRQGKALRRRQLRRSVNSQLDTGENNSKFSSKEHCDTKDPLLTLESPEVEVMKGHCKSILVEVSNCKDMYCGTKCEEPYGRASRIALFEEFSNIGLDRLGIKDLDDIDILGIWKETQPFTDLMGPFWCLRAALGPLVETYLLLDRLLFLQEQGGKVEVKLLPIFDPLLSPRNVAIIAQKK